MLLLPLMRWIKGGWGWGAILYIFREAGRGGLSGRAGFESGQGTGGELSILQGQLCVLAVISVSVPPTWLPPIACSNAERTPPPPPPPVVPAKRKYRVAGYSQNGRGSQLLLSEWTYKYSPHTPTLDHQSRAPYHVMTAPAEQVAR